MEVKEGILLGVKVVPLMVAMAVKEALEDRQMVALAAWAEAHFQLATVPLMVIKAERVETAVTAVKEACQLVEMEV
jgi:acetylornithine/succinyldiaminopimelate/putrescine aminotransferase